jgi:bacillopeptidase F
MLSEVKRNRNNAVKFIVLTGVVGLILFVYGIPLLGRFAAFVSEIAKGDKPITRDDKTPPAPPQVDTPPEYTKDEILKITGNSEEGATIKFTFNGSDEELVSDADGTFSKNLDLKRGENTLVLTAKDTAGNESQKTKTFTIVFDNESPELSVDSPSDGSSFFGTRQRQVDIKGTVDDNESSVTVNDRFVAVEDDGSFQYTTTLSEGENKFNIKAADKAGNSVEKSLTLSFSL